VPGVTKAVILARGLGSRMREGGPDGLVAEQAAAADAGAKAMMPIRAGGGAGRPFLDFTLSGLADAGFRSVCLVIGPEHGETRTYYTDTAPPARLDVHFAVQATPRGTADAVMAAEAFIGEDHVLVINGDNYYPVATVARLAATGAPGTVLFRASTLTARGNIPAERVRAFATCLVGPDGCLSRIVEKPDDEELRAAGADPLVSMNCWLVPPVIVVACRAIAPSPRGEFELANAITYAMHELGVRFGVLISEEGVLDLSRRADVASVAERLAEVSVRP